MKRRHGVRLTAGLLALALCAGVPALAEEDGESRRREADGWSMNEWSEPWRQKASAWAVEDIDRARSLGLDPFDNFVDYQADATREEFAALADQLYTAVQQDYKYMGWEAPFTDVNNSYVDMAWGLGLMQGVSDTEFAPGRSMTRLEICVLLDRTLGVLEAELEEPFAGKAAALAAGSEGAVDGWAAEGVKTVVGAGLMQGTEHGYALGETTTREQAVLLCLRTYDAIRESERLAKEALWQTVFTQAERERAAELKAMKDEMGAGRYQGESPYTQAPNLTPGSFAPGALEEGFVQDGLAAINYVRAVAGLPADVRCTDELNANAQEGALLLAVSEFSHYPHRPDGMEKGLYDAGYAATSSSNIGYGHRTLSGFVLSCTDDSDAGNLDRVGHRRWLFNPDLKLVGLGYVENMTTTKVFDHSRTPSLTPEMVCWPAQGVFPVELADAGLGWSCAPKPGTYDLGASKGLTVTLAREGDGAGFELDLSMDDPQAGAYCHVDTVGYGYGPAIIFRPEVEGYAHGDVYRVRIGNVKRAGGGTTSIEYTVKFFE